MKLMHIVLAGQPQLADRLQKAIDDPNCGNEFRTRFELSHSPEKRLTFTLIIASGSAGTRDGTYSVPLRVH